MSKFEEYLKESNISQSEIAKLLGVSKQLVSCWVKGRSIPLLPAVVKLSEILNVSIEEVVLCFVERKKNEWK